MTTDTYFTSEDGTRAIVKYQKGIVYSLMIVGKMDHVRWGSWKEIMEDVEFFKRTNRLPVSKGKSWH